MYLAPSLYHLRVHLSAIGQQIDALEFHSSAANGITTKYFVAILGANNPRNNDWLRKTKNVTA